MIKRTYTKYKSCSINAKLKQMAAWTCKTHRCFSNMMKDPLGKSYKLCIDCQKLYDEGCHSLRHTLLGIGQDWELRGLYKAALQAYEQGA